MQDLKTYKTTDLVRNILKGSSRNLYDEYFWKHAEENLLISVIDYLKNSVGQGYVGLDAVLWMLNKPLEELDSLFEGTEKIVWSNGEGHKIPHTEKTSLREQEQYCENKNSRICMNEYSFYKESEINRAAMDVRISVVRYCKKMYGDRYFPWIADISEVSTDLLVNAIYKEASKEYPNDLFIRSEKNMLAAVVGYVKDVVGKPHINMAGIIDVTGSSIDGLFNGEYKIDFSTASTNNSLYIKNTRKEQREYLKQIRESDYFKYYISFKKMEAQILTQILKLAAENLASFQTRREIIYA